MPRRVPVAYESAHEEKGVFRWTSVAFNSRKDAIKFQGYLEKIHSTIVAQLDGHIVTTNASGRDIDRTLRRHVWEKGWKVAPSAQAAEGAACPPREREHACSCGHRHEPESVSVDGHAVAGPTVAAECPPERAGNPKEVVVGEFDEIVIVRRRTAAAAGEARDSGGGCGPFTQVTRDPRRFDACMALARQVGPIDNDAALYAIVSPDLARQDQEIFVVVGLDLHNRLRVYAEVARGQRDRVSVSPDDVLRPVLLEGCTAMAVAHNHPSGNPEPSEKDAELTERLRQAAAASRIVFLDHLVIGSAEYYSFADRRVKRAR